MGAEVGFMIHLLSNRNANGCDSASEQKEFDESRAKREAERKKRDAYGVGIAPSIRIF